MSAVNSDIQYFICHILFFAFYIVGKYVISNAALMCTKTLGSERVDLEDGVYGGLDGQR